MEKSKNIAKALLLTIVLMLCLNINNSFAQSLGDPVVDITFGSGTATHSGALPADSGSTSYTYTSADFPSDGYYTIESTTNSPNVWWTTTDHTGNTGGYMMVVNASVSKTDYFYKREVDGLCGGTTYQFGAWMGNLLRYSDLSPPDIIFSIETTDGTVIQSYDTGPIAQRKDAFKWIQFVFDFTLPANTSNIIIKMTNNSNGGAPANDLALDDITFRPYGPSLVAGFSSSSLSSITSCAGQTTPYTLTVAPVSGYTSPAYQWQINNGTSWTDIPGATSLSYTADPTTVGTYEYRLASAEASNIGSASCRVVSNVLTIVIDDTPSSTATANTPLCVGNTLSLTASTGTGYSWTGPNGFTSSIQNPSIDNITAAAAGDYTVIVTSGNCSSSAAVTVNVYAQPVANAGTDVTICQGDNTTLNASGGTSYSWSPTKGLSDPTIADPVASPTDTTAYVVTVSNTNACTATDTVMINVLKKPVANAGANKEITQGQSVTLNGTAKGTDVTYYWTPDTYLSSTTVLNPVATPPADITYTLHVTSTVGCGDDATADVFIRVYKEITIPNTFTPNGDGINDTWDITALDTYPESVTQIFDRYGSLVFASTGYSKAWNGTYNNKNVPVGTYYYLIDLKNGHKYSGWVLVVR
ncbi:gliding motility-associated-like protein [Mucilaginibacter frigoritolerans]|uniref:Gliding motility-associated-like protein n=1 Tax=Mucilaginibacter frigoritolerans TaxID=652788 RepID=A0A562UCF9_9SPHI|nr:gliding motility-associated C-terminal domain-containing protein [Mucilaginibacter frigoritolerans]TWJ03239.1 gliding motility-associated-like protein [Mucilaginibacter frigoritolerans]